MELKSIRVLRKFWYDGAVQEIGKVLRVPSNLAAGFIGMNKAEMVSEPEVKKETKKEELVIDSSQTRAASAGQSTAANEVLDKAKKGGSSK